MRNTIISVLALLSRLVYGQMSPMTLDPFINTSPTLYVASLTLAQGPPIPSYQQLPAGTPLGLYRYTYFSLGPNPDGQTSTFTIGNGVCVLSTGFDGGSALQLIYGFTPSGAAPLGLNLSGYSAFRLNFQGIASTQSLYVNIVVTLHNGLSYDLERVLPPTPNAVSEDFAFSSGNNPASGQPPFDLSDIDYIVVESGGGGTTASFGITSFQAVNP